MLLELVSHQYRSLEVRVQIVVDSLRFTQQNPLGLPMLEYSADGVRFGKHIHVLQLTTANEKFNFLLECRILIWWNSVHFYSN